MGMDVEIQAHCDRCGNMIVACFNRKRAWREVYAHASVLKQKGRPTMIFCGESCKGRFENDNPDWNKLAKR